MARLDLAVLLHQRCRRLPNAAHRGTRGGALSLSVVVTKPVDALPLELARAAVASASVA